MVGTIVPLVHNDYLTAFIMMAVGQICAAISGRPTDPTSLSWDIGMGDDFRPRGTLEPAPRGKPRDTYNLSFAAIS